MLRAFFWGILIIIEFIPFTLGAQEPISKNLFSSENYGAWSLICPKVTASNLPCQLSQIVSKDPQGKKVILGISIYFKDSSQQPVMTFRLSSLADKQTGIGLKIDNGNEYRLPMTECTAKACIATGLIDDTMIESFNQGKLLQFAFIVEKKQLTIPVSLQGFSDAFLKLKQNSMSGN